MATQQITNVSEEDVLRLKAEFESSGATVTVTQEPDGTFTVVATLEGGDPLTGMKPPH